MRIEPGDPSHGAGSAQRKRILIVDDEPSLRRSIGRLLRTAGYQPSEARNVREASAALRAPRAAPDVMILDLRMPDEGGLSFMRRLPQPLPVPVIVFSGLGTVEEAVSALKLGASDFIIKPASLERLVDAIDAALRREDLAASRACAAILDGETPPATRGSYRAAVADYEREILSRALTRCKGNVAAAARILDTDRGNLRRKLAQLGVEASSCIDGERSRSSMG